MRLLDCLGSIMRPFFDFVGDAVDAIEPPASTRLSRLLISEPFAYGSPLFEALPGRGSI
jgi:hypothetical protein